MDMFSILIILVSWMYMSKLIKVYTSDISSLLHAKQNSIKIKLKDVGGKKLQDFLIIWLIWKSVTPEKSNLQHFTFKK